MLRWQRQPLECEEFFGAEELLGAGANIAAALDGSGNLGEVHDAEIEFRVALGVVGEGAGDGFGAGHALEIVEDVSRLAACGK